MSAIVSKFNRLFDIIDHIVDERVGIIQYVMELPRDPGGPNFFHFTAQSCDASAFNARKNFGFNGGVSSERQVAMAKAIGEAIERYCSAFFHVEDLPLVSFESASFPCVHPSDFALYSSEQYASPGFPFVPFEAQTPIRWSKAFDAQTGQISYVPAAMVYIPYAYDRQAGELPIAQPVTTGLACHCSFAEAAISAICEVVERDAFTITWQARLGTPRIGLQSLSRRNRDLVERFERTGGAVTLHSITMDHGIPAIMSVLHMPTVDAPARVFAAAAHLDPEQAVRKCLEELAHTRHFAHHLQSLPPIDPGLSFELINTQDAHVQLYCCQGNIGLTDFICRSGCEISFHEISDEATGKPEFDLQTLINKVNSVGHRVLLADVTTPDVGNLGLTVLRAIIPGFHPLCFGHRIRALGGKRLWELPQKLGYKGISPETGDNPAPHPFP